MPDVVAEFKDFATAYKIKKSFDIGSIVAECKYSINQSWHRKLVDKISKPVTVSDGIVDLLFWDLDMTPDLFKKKIRAKHLTISKIPRLITDKLTQVESYSTLIEAGTIKNIILSPVQMVSVSPPVLPIVVLAQKQSSIRIAFSRLETIKKLIL